MWRLDWSLMMLEYSLKVLAWFARTACWSLATASGVHMWSSPRARQAYSPPTSSMLASSGSSLKAAVWLRMVSSATSKMPMPPTWVLVPGKYPSTRSRLRPTASKICAPQ